MCHVLLIFTIICARIIGAEFAERLKNVAAGELFVIFEH